MASTLNGTGITFSDGSTAAGTALYAIGTSAMGRPANATAYAVNSTIAGSSLYATGTGLRYGAGVGFVDVVLNEGANSNSFTLINTGTWRCVSPAGWFNSVNGMPGLWIRIS